MSKIAISGASTGTATFTLESPATSTNRTLTLPDNTGTILTNATAGTVLQVVTATTNTPVTITSTSMTDLGLSASITPTSASSKILVLVNQNLTNYQNTSSSRNFGTQLLRGATIISNKLFYSYAGAAGNGYVELTLDGTYILLDSPATTSSTTYKTQGTVSSSADDTTLVGQAGSRTSSITLMEIAA